MKNRKKMNSRKSKKLFTKTADGTHRFNLGTKTTQMRGGIRM
jgi:hypothetical protein